MILEHIYVKNFVLCLFYAFDYIYFLFFSSFIALLLFSTIQCILFKVLTFIRPSALFVNPTFPYNLFAPSLCTCIFLVIALLSANHVYHVCMFNVFLMENEMITSWAASTYNLNKAIANTSIIKLYWLLLSICVYNLCNNVRAGRV